MKKVFDILPPKEKKAPPKKEKEESFFEESKSEKVEKRKWRKGWFFIFLIFIILGVINFSLVNAKIHIWPKTEVLNFKTEVRISKDAKDVDLKNSVLPGKIFEEKITISEEFPATGEVIKSEKASGIIRIYNNSERIQELIANTRFQAPLEKFQPPLEEEKKEYPWFRILERVVIPPKSFVDVKVVADSPGEKYNIGPTKFSIPGLRGTPQYTLVYGESFEPMKGGVLKKVPQVKKEDLENAKKELEKKVIEEGRETLKNKISKDYQFFEDVLKIEILNGFSLVTSGAEVEKFNYQLEALSQTLAFKKEDVKNFAKEFIISQIPPEKKICPESLKLNYSLKDFNLETKNMTIFLDMESKIYYDVDLISLKKGLAGKSLIEVQNILKEFPQISRSEIKIFPFWQKHIPKDLEKINLKLLID